MKMTFIKIGARTVGEKHLFQKEKGLKGERKEKCSTLMIFAKLPVMDLTTAY